MSHGYLESLDGSQSYSAAAFSYRKDLEHGKIYALEELIFQDWLITTRPHKPPQKKLIFRLYTAPPSDKEG
jgi:hypothetical protein